jgi:hypothetical protein
MKKFLLPFQNMVPASAKATADKRADLFSGSLAVWKKFGFTARFAPSRTEFSLH